MGPKCRPLSPRGRPQVRAPACGYFRSCPGASARSKKTGTGRGWGCVRDARTRGGPYPIIGEITDPCHSSAGDGSPTWGRCPKNPTNGISLKHQLQPQPGGVGPGKWFPCIVSRLLPSFTGTWGRQSGAVGGAWGARVQGCLSPPANEPRSQLFRPQRSRCCHCMNVKEKSLRGKEHVR